ncbi:hypothetical protein [Streptomyces sp. NPDC014734]|uniref:hypothetical protein n=1 Tax=Streptomyces sp. NPDC014734 TaxID=3364886 RepID=UPI0036F7C610
MGRAGRPPPGTTGGTQVSRKSLLADVVNLTARSGRLAACITRLERRLSEVLGQTARGSLRPRRPADVETLTRQIAELERQILDLRAALAERDENLVAARAANREFMAHGPDQRPAHALTAPALTGFGFVKTQSGG